MELAEGWVVEQAVHLVCPEIGASWVLRLVEDLRLECLARLLL